MHIALNLPFNETQALEIIDSLFEEVSVITIKFDITGSFLSEISKRHCKVNVFGKWYNSPLVEQIKEIIKKQDADKVLNLCIEYDGQEEILDACRLIARQVKAGKIDPDTIEKQDIKSNLYTSEIPPPDIIIQSNGAPFLLWDSEYSRIRYTDNLKRKHILKLIKS
ncbi:MAG: undecaprenyl diphosphate synthase family protein [Candidatus Woesearchaeota archaeon]